MTTFFQVAGFLLFCLAVVAWFDEWAARDKRKAADDYEPNEEQLN